MMRRKTAMKKRFGFTLALALSVLIFASAGPVLAYTVTGDLKTPGTYTSTTSGVLNSVLSGIGGGISNARLDYIVATGANGALATFSGDEISPSLQQSTNTFGGNYITISADTNGDGGFTLSGDGQSITNVSNISVNRASAPPGIYPTGP